jgi:hypothetical protein
VTTSRTSSGCFGWPPPTQLTLQASTPGGATQKVKTRNLPNTLRNDITFRLHNEGALQDVGGQFWERISSENDELVQATDALHSLSRQYDQETLRFLVKVLEQEEIIGDSEILESLRQLKKASRAKARKRA